MHALHVKSFRDLADQRRILVDNRDIVIFSRKVLSDAGTDLTGTADDNFRRDPVLKRMITRSVQR